MFDEDLFFELLIAQLFHKDYTLRLKEKSEAGFSLLVFIYSV
jgi:hypothetical protein